MYTIKQLEKMNICKGDLIKKMNWKVYDTALPQNWLNWFTDESGLDYWLILSTTVWSYDSNTGFGQPISACIEVQKKIDELK